MPQRACRWLYLHVLQRGHIGVDDAADALENNPDPAIQRAGEEVRAELDARRLFEPGPGAQGGAGADEVKEQ